MWIIQNCKFFFQPFQLINFTYTRQIINFSLASFFFVVCFTQRLQIWLIIIKVLFLFAGCCERWKIRLAFSSSTRRSHRQIINVMTRASSRSTGGWVMWSMRASATTTRSCSPTVNNQLTWTIATATAAGPLTASLVSLLVKIISQIIAIIVRPALSIGAITLITTLMKIVIARRKEKRPASWATLRNSNSYFRSQIVATRTLAPIRVKIETRKRRSSDSVLKYPAARSGSPALVVPPTRPSTPRRVIYPVIIVELISKQPGTPRIMRCPSCW